MIQISYFKRPQCLKESTEKMLTTIELTEQGKGYRWKNQ